MPLPNSRDLRLELHVECCFGPVAFIANKAQVRLSMLSTQDQWRNVIHLGAELASDLANADNAMIVVALADAVSDARRDLCVIGLTDPFGDFAAHAAAPSWNTTP
jgi:hypothetical protein